MYCYCSLYEVFMYFNMYWLSQYIGIVFHRLYMFFSHFKAYVFFSSQFKAKIFILSNLNAQLTIETDEY
jgi:hypothetical protein